METFYFLEKALLTLNNEELKRFEKFVHSPYFTNNHANNNAVKKLFEYIKPIIKNKSNFKGFDWNKAVKKLFSHKSILPKNCVTKLKSELFIYLLMFFNIEYLKKDRLLCKISILNELNNRNLEDCFRHYCSEYRFDELNSDKGEPKYSFYLWSLVKALNRNKEKKVYSASLKSDTQTGKIDFNEEKFLLKKYFKEELKSLHIREKKLQLAEN